MADQLFSKQKTLVRYLLDAPSFIAISSDTAAKAILVASNGRSAAYINALLYPQSIEVFSAVGLRRSARQAVNMADRLVW